MVKAEVSVLWMVKAVRLVFCGWLRLRLVFCGWLRL